jgi:2-polyprenyl-6-hydroxyphenyl methylase / 3-demethylubiquinone-9 3-methyltransferase
VNKLLWRSPLAHDEPVPLLRNDPRQYDRLVGEWWRPDGVFTMLHWIAVERGHLIPPPASSRSVLVDVGCGGGILAPHVKKAGYRHVGVDVSESALKVAAAHGVTAVRADVRQLPIRSGSAEVVVAGEILEHVAGHAATAAEACRILRRGGRLVIDTIARTRRARLIVVDIAERIPGGAPPGIHDPQLFVDRKELVETCRRLGVPITLRGLRPALLPLLGLRRPGRRPMRQARDTGVLFQAWGDKR